MCGHRKETAAAIRSLIFHFKPPSHRRFPFFLAPLLGIVALFFLVKVLFMALIGLAVFGLAFTAVRAIARAALPPCVSGCCNLPTAIARGRQLPRVRFRLRAIAAMHCRNYLIFKTGAADQPLPHQNQLNHVLQTSSWNARRLRICLQRNGTSRRPLGATPRQPRQRQVSTACKH